MNDQDEQPFLGPRCAMKGSWGESSKSRHSGTRKAPSREAEDLTLETWVQGSGEQKLENQEQAQAGSENLVTGA